MATVDITSLVKCAGGPRCLCPEHTDERMRKATAPPRRRVTPITDLLDAEETSRYLNLAVDSLVVQKAAALEENDQLRAERKRLNGWVRSRERRVEQVLLHRWRSRIWTALLTTVVVLVLDGTIARWFA